MSMKKSQQTEKTPSYIELRKCDMTRPFAFVSYSSEDSYFVRSEIKRLQERNCNIWIDVEGLGHHADSWWNDAKEALGHKNCQLILFYMSTHSLNSQNCLDEMEYRKKDYGKKLFWIAVEAVPLDNSRLDNSSILPKFKELQKKDLKEKNRYVFVQNVESQEYEKRLSNLEADIMNPLLALCREDYRKRLNAQKVKVEDLKEELSRPVFREDGTKVDDLAKEITDENGPALSILKAEGGMGKTFLVFWMMKKILNEYNWPCVYFSGRSLTSDIVKNDGIYRRVSDLIMTNGRSNIGKIESYCLNKGFIVVFIDGYNEIPDEIVDKKTGNTIKDIVNATVKTLKEKHVRVVVSTRNSIPPLEPFYVYTKGEIETALIQEMLKKKGLNYDALHYNLQRILHVPMFLSLFLDIGENDDQQTINTAAELMDAERRRIIEQAVGSHLEREKRENYLKEFARFSHAYYVKERNLAISVSELDDKLFKIDLNFLLDNAIVYYTNDDKTQITYNHEHFRDYWVAKHIRDSLLQITTGNQNDAVDKINALMCVEYSNIVLQYIGELDNLDTEAIREKLENTEQREDSAVFLALNVLRCPSSEVWVEDETTGEATARLIEILKLLTKNRLPGMDFSGLNLRRTKLNGIQTVRGNITSCFDDAIVVTDTFVPGTHQSTSRGLQMLYINNRQYIVSISDYDMLIMCPPAMKPITRYSHEEPEMRVLLSMAGDGRNNILGIDRGGNLWHWRFFQGDDGQIKRCLNRLYEGTKDRKAWCIVRTRNGNFCLQYNTNNNESYDMLSIISENGGEYRIEEPKSIGVNGNCNYSLTEDREGCYCWAVFDQEKIELYKKTGFGRLTRTQKIHTIDFQDESIRMLEGEQGGVKRGRMYYSCYDEVETFLLAVSTDKRTFLFQISKGPGTEKWEHRRIKWPNNEDILVNDFEEDKNHHLIHSFVKDDRGEKPRVIACEGKGHLFRFCWDSQKAEWKGENSIKVASPEFHVVDYVPLPFNERGKSIPKFVTTAWSMAVLLYSDDGGLLQEVKGYNLGIRKLDYIENGEFLLASKFDGGFLIFHREDKGKPLRLERVLADCYPDLWCWSFHVLGDSKHLVAGYQEGKICLVDYIEDKKVAEISLAYQYGDVKNRQLEKKIENLYYHDESGWLYVATLDGLFALPLNTEKKCFEPDKTVQLTTCQTYRFLRMDDYLYVAGALNTKKDPCIFIVRLNPDSHGVFEKPFIAGGDAIWRRFKDLDYLGDHYILACGPQVEENNSPSQIYILSVKDDPLHPKVVGRFGGLSGYVNQCAVHIEEDGSVRIAFLVGNGNLFQGKLTAPDGDNPPKLDGKLRKRTQGRGNYFPNRATDLIFTEEGDLLVAGLDDGALMLLPWESDEKMPLFHNYSYMYTCCTDMSGLNVEVEPLSEELKELLIDYNNVLPDAQE